MPMAGDVNSTVPAPDVAAPAILTLTRRPKCRTTRLGAAGRASARNSVPQASLCMLVRRPQVQFRSRTGAAGAGCHSLWQAFGWLAAPCPSRLGSPASGRDQLVGATTRSSSPPLRPATISSSSASVHHTHSGSHRRTRFSIRSSISSSPLRRSCTLQYQLSHIPKLIATIKSIFDTFATLANPNPTSPSKKPRTFEAFPLLPPVPRRLINSFARPSLTAQHPQHQWIFGVPDELTVLESLVASAAAYARVSTL
ncbi:hypothetical protein PaG_02620 [Moesziomyces aphidis]|uniref:Uncharacterized protein n=1 Tax=Moesziomyces aphidis TaxID=84754 RepID=W3VQ13_MOEAP|nr:hypothetical protein PaG_02620 [Moesziomyces aphidis]